MTQQPLIDHAYAGIECILQGSRAKTLVNGATRYEALVSFTATPELSQLIADLVLHNKRNVVVSFGFAEYQAELPLDDEEEDEVPGVVRFRHPNGEIILQHAFRASEEDPAKCTFCQQGEPHDIHRFHPADNGSEPPSRLEPGDASEAAEQALAEAALAARSRG